MKTIATLMSLALLAAAAPAAANPEADYRHHVMEAVGGHMQSMAVILRRQVHLEDFAAHAESMAALASVVPGVFPEGSLTADSKALPAIWENPEDFQQAVDRFVAAAKALAAAAPSGEMSQIGPAMGALGDSCKGCHDSYKAE